MKLHLPKLLCVAVMAAMALPAMGGELTSTTYTDEYGQEHTKWDVGHAVVGETKPYDNPTKYLDGETDLTLDGKDTLGVYNDGVFYEGGFTVIRGQAPSRYGTYTYTMDEPNKGVTNDFHINGTLTLKDDSKVNLGGQFRKEYLKNATATSYTGDYDEYIGLKATKVVVQDNASLYSTKARIGTLQIDGGNVKLKSGWTSGSTSAFADADRGDSKQTQILEKLDLNGGTLSIGTTGANAKHWHQVFGGAIEQDTGSTMHVYGNSIWKSGISITQEGGTMNFCDTVGKISLSGDATIKQTGAGTMNFGELYSTSSRTVGIEQTGNGTINLKNGVTYKSKTASTISQTGNGIINLSGDYSSAIFNIDQTASGTINLKKGAVMVANTVNVGKEATLNVDGSMTVNGTSTLSGTVNVAENATFTLNGATTVKGNSSLLGNVTMNGDVTFDETANLSISSTLSMSAGHNMTFNIANLAEDHAAMTMTENGNLAIMGGTISLELSDVAVQEMAEGATYEGTEYHVTLIDNLSAADVGELESILNTDLTLESYELTIPVTLAATATDPITITSDTLVIEDNALKAVVLSTKSIPEPTTATLSLLALAALAARRRRASR